MNIVNRALYTIGSIFLVILFIGCGTAMDSVRAWRQHGQEPSNIEVLSDRLNDLSLSLELVHKMLFEVKYTPGAKWVSALSLSDEQADKIRSELQDTGVYKNPQFRVPVARIYREHIRRVLGGAKSAGKDGGQHILAALKQVAALEGVTVDELRAALPVSIERVA